MKRGNWLWTGEGWERIWIWLKGGEKNLAEKHIWSVQNLGYASKFYLCSSFTPYMTCNMFPEKNWEGKLAERGDGSLCSEDSRILGSECRKYPYTSTNVSEVQTDNLFRIDAGNTHLHNLGTYYISLYTASSPGNENHRHHRCKNCISRVSTHVLQAVSPDMTNLHTRRQFHRTRWPVKTITASEIIIYCRGSPG